MVFKVGLTGGIASGKTTVSDLFMQHGIEVIDADIIARQLLDQGTACYREVVALFGPEVLMETSDINRAWLRDRIFTDAHAKKQLEAIIHPRVRELMFDAAERCQQPYCILSIPLLVEASMQDLVDRVLVIDADPANQTTRLITRDGINQQQAVQMLAGQTSREQRLTVADDIVDNNGPVDQLKQQVEQLHQQYLKLAATER